MELDLKSVLSYDPETGVFRWLASGPGRPGATASTFILRYAMPPKKRMRHIWPRPKSFTANFCHPKD